MHVLNMRDPAVRAAVQRGEPGYLYIGRGPARCHMMNTPIGQKGWLGNPVARGEVCPRCSMVHTTPGVTLECYKKLLLTRMEDQHFLSALREALVVNEYLVCWCRPKPCHGDILWTYWSSRVANTSEGRS